MLPKGAPDPDADAVWVLWYKPIHWEGGRGRSYGKHNHDAVLHA